MSAATALLIAIATTTWMFLPNVPVAEQIVVPAVMDFRDMLDRPAEYLFFIGASFIALLLLERRRRAVALVAFLVGVAWVTYLPSVLDYVHSLGTDSFFEARSFNPDEARAWLGTLSEAIYPTFAKKQLLLYALLTIALFASFNWLLGKAQLASRRHAGLLSFAAALLALAVHQTVSASVSVFLRNTEAMAMANKNFSPTQLPPIAVEGKSIHVLVYIGEATSVMNMGVYGYPRDTTPRLARLAQSDSNLLLFHNVLSTHTHTSQSLLEAFSFAVDERENSLPIHMRKRISIVDLLRAGGIESSLISNQERTGYWNQVSTIVFGNAHRIFSTDEGNEHQANFDHAFFADQVEEGNLRGNGRTALTFFHSFAGHVPYLPRVPEAFRQPVDDWLKHKSSRSVVGYSTYVRKPMETVEAYDSAVRYVDFSISQAVEFVKRQSQPTVLVYFSDHGESPYTGRAHDSARFVHEMMRIPFLMYFNEAARTSERALYEKYRVLSTRREIATLAQLSSTLLDLLGVRVVGEPGAPLVRTPPIGEHVPSPWPVVVRETSEGISYVNIKPTPLRVPRGANRPFIDRTDDATETYVVSRNAAINYRRVCYGQVHSLAKALRGAIVAPCLAIEVAASPNGRLSVLRPPEEDTDLELGDVLKVATHNELGLWIDGGRLRTERECVELSNALEGQSNAAQTSLVDLPYESQATKPWLAGCLERLQQKGVAVSYRVASDRAVSCSDSLRHGKTFDSDPMCQNLKRDIQRAVESGLFSDLTVPYSGLMAVEQLELAKRFRWHVRDVSAASLGELSGDRVRMISLRNRDPNDD